MLEGSYGPIGILHLSIGSTCSSILRLSICSSCVLSDFIADLSSSPTSSKLPMRLKSIVPVNSDHSSIEDSSIQGLYGEGRLMARCILYEAKSAGLHLDAIKTHYKIYDLAAGGEKLQELALESEEG